MIILVGLAEMKTLVMEWKHNTVAIIAGIWVFGIATVATNISR